MKKNYLVVVIIGVIVLVAVLTNPSEDRHREAMKSRLNAHMQKTIKQRLGEDANGLEGLAQALGAILGGSVVSGLVENVVSSDNYVLFSTTKMTWEGESKVVGVGAFGNVFISNKIDKALDEEFMKIGQ
jgi:predicted lysophospholipase L1 biosynthesis ABC-type transport system permease subunit